MKTPIVQESLFDPLPPPTPTLETIAEGAVILRGYAVGVQHLLVQSIKKIEASSPFRHMITPGGFQMSVAMTNCGPLGWVSDRRGYRYDSLDPLNGQPWPAFPESFLQLAVTSAATAGFANFSPDACLINKYEPGARMSLHQDKDETDFAQPIVSVSLGLPATFLFGGSTRKDRPQRFRLESGDVVVWGGPTRLAYHGVTPLASGDHPLTGPFRINLTFRRAA